MASTKSISDLGQPLAVGNTAEVYAWEQGWVLKLFFERYSSSTVDFEHRMAAAISATTLPVPAVGEKITIGNRVGVLYERRDGQELWNALAKRPWRIRTYAHLLAQLHAQLHSASITVNFPLLSDRLVYKIQQAKPLPAHLRSAALETLGRLPAGNSICHGDFHPGNVLLSHPTPTIIDWIDASLGNPLADVARTSILLLGFAETEASLPERWLVRLFHTIYLRRYFEIRPNGRQEYQTWLPIIAAARLEEKVEGWEDWLIKQAMNADTSIEKSA